ncbi:MAG: class I SAM-dependent methyltransferase [Anaerolineales bacterium]|jgi:SAM-dependent methyltransferase
MTLSSSRWHQRYLQQARWTQNLRKYIYDQVVIQRANKILDIGVGTGVLENELNRNSPSHVFGLDIDSSALRIAQEYAPKSVYTVGDCINLPFQTRVFDVTLCHFLLLWVKDALNAVEEMARVTRPNGYVLALAEPDYGGRIDFPSELSQLGIWQTEALREQGANPFMGREVRSIFSRAGLVNIDVGVLGGQWGENISDQDLELEWEVIQSDLRQNNDFILQADRLKDLELTSRKILQRILFVPTFYAIGVVKG